MSDHTARCAVDHREGVVGTLKTRLCEVERSSGRLSGCKLYMSPVIRAKVCILRFPAFRINSDHISVLSDVEDSPPTRIPGEPLLQVSQRYQ
jgi:hypothetical protein